MIKSNKIQKIFGGTGLFIILLLLAVKLVPTAKGKENRTQKTARRHWAHVKPERPPLPRVQNSSWVRNAIDNFVLTRLEKEGLRPSPEAHKETLIRRVSLDLTGFPPSVKEVDAFLADKSPDAYQNVMNRLLASPHYGERWARMWLDMARYADTNGYERDRKRTMWLYRDWVIEAFNRNMPFDQFSVEQLAGDLLPNATVKQIIATGFHRNTMINDEPGAYAEDFRVAAIVDRVNTTATVWLGTTLACAQCHDHKYDPFTQEEYYQFFAFFNNDQPDILTDAFNIRLLSWGPQAELPTPEQAAQRKKLSDEITRLEKILYTPTRGLEAAQAKWEQELAGDEVAWTVLDPTTFYSVAGAKLTKADDNSLRISGKLPDEDAFVVEAQTEQTGITGLRLQVLPHQSRPGDGSPQRTNGSLALTSLKIEASPATLERNEAEASSLSSAVMPDQVGLSIALAERFSDRGWAVFDGKSQEAVFVIQNPFGFEQGTKLKIMLIHESEGNQEVAWRFRLSITTAKHPGLRLMKDLLPIPSAQRTAAQKQQLAAYYRSVNPLLQPIRDRLARARKSLNSLQIPTTLVIQQRAEPRKTYVHLRGNFLHKGKRVWPDVPASLHPFRPGLPQNRFDLARWLVDRDNPLVARVTVNRFWQEIFGRGIVETSGDFGTRGEPPIHPQLLDWLANEFMRTGWDMKALLRLILTSATYRQSSRVTPELLERDPYNRLLARGPRFRVEAEAVRDIVLTVSGLLNRKVGGPSVFPPQPEGILQNSFGFYELKARWENDTDENRYRRGLYTFWKRTAPYPSFLTFDAPRREVCTVKRSRTNTPLQALTTLNDPAFVEAAVGLAQRLMIEASPGVRERATYGFRLCVSRIPEKDELTSLIALYNKALKQLKQDAARALVTSYELEPPEELNLRELAAWAVVSRVLLNLDETITKG